MLKPTTSTLPPVAKPEPVVAISQSADAVAPVVPVVSNTPPPANPAETPIITPLNIANHTPTAAENRADEIKRRISERLKQVGAKSPRGNHEKTEAVDPVPDFTPRTVAQYKDQVNSPRLELLEEEKKQAEIKKRIAERKFNEEMKRQAQEAANRKAAEEAQREKEKEASKAALEKAIAEARLQANAVAAAAARKRATEKAAEMAKKKAEEDAKKRLEEEAAAAIKKQAEEEAARKREEAEALTKLQSPSIPDDELNQEIDLDQVCTTCLCILLCESPV